MMKASSFVLCASFASGSHYEKPPCQSDEKAVQVQGVSGDMCSPSCTSGSCPTDVVSGVTAKPTCALKDTSGDKYCALICSADSECDKAGGASCQKIQGVGICTYPASKNVLPAPVTIITKPATAHYEKPPCQSDEKAVQVQGLSGDMCSPACTSGSCPTDVVSGVSAKPTCALQDTSGNKYCALICSADSDCDSVGGASCQKIQGTGICTYPTSAAFSGRRVIAALSGTEALLV